MPSVDHAAALPAPTEAPTALVVNFFGGPGAGKTYASASLFTALKRRGIDCEYIDEQARQCIQTGQVGALAVQPYLFGMSLYRIRTTSRQTRVLVLDSPLLLNIVYDRKQSRSLRSLVIEEHHTFSNWNLFIERTRLEDHSTSGRVHDRAQSEEYHERIRRMLDELAVPYESMDGSAEAIEQLADQIAAHLLHPGASPSARA